MKKIIIIIIMFSLLFIFFQILVNKNDIDLTKSEWMVTIQKAENNNSKAYLKLFMYYNQLHNDSDSAWKIICKGKSIGNKDMAQYWNHRKKVDMSLCDNTSLYKLPNYGSIYYPWEW